MGICEWVAYVFLVMFACYGTVSFIDDIATGRARRYIQNKRGLEE